MNAYPKHISVEPVAGMCTCTCTMCAISNFKRKKEVMTNAGFKKIIEKIKQSYKHLDTFSFVGMGETLLDKHIDEKIKMLKDSGCTANIAVVTNCTELNEEMSRKLLLADLDLIICSIDGVNKETHEKIRVGTDFEQVRTNLIRFVELRKEIKKQTRILLRFIRQQCNKDEVEPFKTYWNNYIDKSYGDEITIYDIHNIGGSLEDFDEVKVEGGKASNINFCKDLMLGMMIYADGTVPLCCADANADFVKSSNIFETSLEEAFNSEQRVYIKNMILQGRINELPHCGVCTLPESVSKTGRDIADYYKSDSVRI